MLSHLFIRKAGDFMVPFMRTHALLETFNTLDATTVHVDVADGGDVGTGRGSHVCLWKPPSTALLSSSTC